MYTAKLAYSFFLLFIPSLIEEIVKSTLKIQTFYSAIHHYI